MTKEQAIKVINEATANFQGTRKDHQLIVEAINLLMNLKECECPKEEETQE